ncbi:MAG: ASCH domain-containing protein [Christensenella sp.]|nr:ASCH domain-containing protein [Christensenella sp.]
MNTEQFWQAFLRDTDRSPDTRYLECFHFDLNERSANELLALVLSGKKRATASSLYAFPEGGQPKPGDLSIVTDWGGNPRCVIETRAITILPFREMTFEICSREGEDECLETWQAGHRRFFSKDGEALGYTFSEDMPVVFEDFEVVYAR